MSSHLVIYIYGKHMKANKNQLRPWKSQLKPIKKRKKTCFFMVYSILEEKTWFFRFSWKKRKYYQPWLHVTLPVIDSIPPPKWRTAANFLTRYFRLAYFLSQRFLSHAIHMPEPPWIIPVLHSVHHSWLLHKNYLHVWFPYHPTCFLLHLTYIRKNSAPYILYPTLPSKFTLLTLHVFFIPPKIFSPQILLFSHHLADLNPDWNSF